MGNFQSNDMEKVNGRTLENHTIVISLHTVSLGFFLDNGTITCPFLTTVEDLKIGIEKLLRIPVKDQILGDKTKVFRIINDTKVYSLLRNNTDENSCDNDYHLVIYTKGFVPGHVCICDTFKEIPPLILCPACVLQHIDG